MNNIYHLFSHPPIDHQLLEKISQTHEPVVQIRIPPARPEGTAGVQLEIELAATGDLPPEWLINHLTIWLIGPGQDLDLNIMAIISKHRGQDGFLHFHLKTWPTAPVSLDRFTDIHLFTSTGLAWSGTLDRILAPKVSLG